MTVEHAQPRSPKTSLPMTQQRERHDNIERQKQEMLNALIGEQVLHTLGKPASLLKVSVRPLWKNIYRVNVFIGPDAVTSTIANSFFLNVNDDGNIVTSTPKIKKQY